MLGNVWFLSINHFCTMICASLRVFFCNHAYFLSIARLASLYLNAHGGLKSYVELRFNYSNWTLLFCLAMHPELEEERGFFGLVLEQKT